MTMLHTESRSTLLYKKSLAILWIVIATLTVAVLALFAGYFAAIYPSWFVLKVGILLSGLVLFIIALWVPSEDTAPVKTLRVLMNSLLLLWGVWPSYMSYKLGSLPDISPIRLAYWVLIGVWLFSITSSRQFRADLFERMKPFKVFLWILLLFAVWQIVCGFFSKEWFYSSTYAIRTLLPSIVVFLTAVTVYKSMEEVERAMAIIVSAATFAAVVGLVEVIHGKNLFLRFLPTDPEQLQSLAWIIVEKSREGSQRIASTFTHPLALAEYLAMCLPLAAYLMLKGRTQFRRWLGAGAIPLVVVANYFTHTRSSMIAVLAIVLVFASIVGMREMRQTRRFARSLLGAFMLVVVVASSVLATGTAIKLVEGRTAGERGSTEARVIMYQRGTDAIAKQPVVGYGPGVAAYIIGLLPGQVVYTIDSYYLSVAIESGVLGLALFLGLLTYPIYFGARTAVTDPGRFGWLGLSIALSLMAFAVEKSVLSLTNNFDFFWVLVGLLFAGAWLNGREGNGSSVSSPLPG